MSSVDGATTATASSLPMRSPRRPPRRDQRLPLLPATSHERAAPAERGRGYPDGRLPAGLHAYFATLLQQTVANPEARPHCHCPVPPDSRAG